MDFVINNAKYLNLLWVTAAVGAVLVIGLVMRTRAKKCFADAGLWRHLLPNDKPALHKIRAGLLIATLAAMALALADVRWGKQWTELPQRGIDIMFVVDVSRSMLARDAKPSRLGRAKQYIRDVMAEMGGDRAGLVVFAGKAKQKVPLTSNYSDISMALDEIAPQSVPRGGSQVGEAIRAASNCFVDKLPNHKAVIVFSDGEDQGSYPVEAAKKAYEDKGVRVFTVGLGDAKEGARIPVKNIDGATLYLKYQGREVFSKMKPDQLKAIALAGGGAFIPAGTKQVNLADVYHTHIAEIPQREFRHARVNQYLPRYQWFAGAALLLLLLETVLAGRRNPSRRKRQNWLWDRIRARYKKTKHGPMQYSGSSNHENKTKHTISTLLAISLVTLTVVEATRADSPRQKYNQSVAEYHQGRYDQARKLLAESLVNPDEVLEAKAKFNLGNCDYATALQHVTKKEKDKAVKLLEKAITQYTEALEVNAADSDARANIELAQLLIDQLKKEEKQKKQQQKQQQQKKQQQKQNQKQNKDQKQKQQNQKKKQDQKDQSKQNQDQKKQNERKEKQKKQSSKDQKKQDEKKEKQEQKPNPEKPQQKQDRKQQQKQNQTAAQKPKEAKEKPQAGDQVHVEPKKAKRKVPPEKARRMLQTVRDKNLKRRREKLRRQRAIQAPVEKDW